MSACHYCGEPARHTLDTFPICWDCLQRANIVPLEARAGTILDSLTRVHASVLKMDGVSGYRAAWLEELGRRLAWCRLVPAEGVEVGDSSREGSIDLEGRMLHTTVGGVTRVSTGVGDQITARGMSPETAQEVDEIVTEVRETVADLVASRLVQEVVSASPSLKPIKVRRR